MGYRDIENWYNTRPLWLRAILVAVFGLPFLASLLVVSAVTIVVSLSMLFAALPIIWVRVIKDLRKFQLSMAQSGRLLPWTEVSRSVSVNQGVLLVEQGPDGFGNVWWIAASRSFADPERILPTFGDLESRGWFKFIDDENVDRQHRWAKNRLGEFASTAQLVTGASYKSLERLDNKIKNEVVLLLFLSPDSLTNRLKS